MAGVFKNGEGIIVYVRGYYYRKMKKEKKKYSVLIVAYDVGLLLVLSLVTYLKRENPLAEISLMTNRKLDSITGQISKYVSKVIHIRAYSGRFKKEKAVQLVNRFFFLFSFFRLSFSKYDIVNVHFAKPVLLKAMPWIAKSSKNIVITPWGSDVLRLEDENAIKRMRLIYGFASYVTCRPDTQLGISVIEKFKFDPKRMCPLRWGGRFC